MFKTAASNVHQRALRGVVIVVACALCGTFDILNNNFALWVARASAFPEEEEPVAKDRATLIAIAQPSRRGLLPPHSGRVAHQDGRSALYQAVASRRVSGPDFHRQLLGAGIFQHC